MSAITDDLVLPPRRFSLWTAVRRNPTIAFGAVLLGALIVVAVFAPYINPTGQVEALFVQVLCIARQMKLLKLGTISLDGTKIHANASRHSALSYGHAQKIEAQLQAEVKELLARAEAADQEPLPEGLLDAAIKDRSGAYYARAGALLPMLPAE